MNAKLIGDIGAMAAFLVLAGHATFYAAFSPWWRSATGRSLMTLIAVLAAVMTLTVSTLWLGVQWPGRDVLRAVIFWSVALAAGNLLVTHVMQKVTSWREARRAQEEETP